MKRFFAHTVPNLKGIVKSPSKRWLLFYDEEFSSLSRPYILLKNTQWSWEKVGVYKYHLVDNLLRVIVDANDDTSANERAIVLVEFYLKAKNK